MIDISLYKVPEKVQAVAEKLNQYIYLMGSMKRKFTIFLYSEDYETLNRFTKEITGNKYNLSNVSWRGHAITRGGIRK